MTDIKSNATAGTEGGHTPDLLPCPFCGGDDIYTEPDEIGGGGQWVFPVMVGCKACVAEVVGEDPEDATDKWNTRAAPATAAERDALLAVNAELVAALEKLQRGVEADAECQGYDPRDLMAAHTWLAMAMKDADAALAKARDHG